MIVWFQRGVTQRLLMGGFDLLSSRLETREDDDTNNHTIGSGSERLATID